MDLACNPMFDIVFGPSYDTAPKMDWFGKIPVSYPAVNRRATKSGPMLNLPYPD